MRVEFFPPQRRRRGKRSRMHSLGFAVPPLEDNGLGNAQPPPRLQLMPQLSKPTYLIDAHEQPVRASSSRDAHLVYGGPLRDVCGPSTPIGTQASRQGSRRRVTDSSPRMGCIERRCSRGMHRPCGAHGTDVSQHGGGCRGESTPRPQAPGRRAGPPAPVRCPGRCQRWARPRVRHYL